MIKVVLILGLIFRSVLSQNIKTYPNLSIDGQDINGVLGASTSCIQACQNKQNCRAWTWDDTNGGTCWLKNDTQPLSKVAKPGTLTGIMAPPSALVYKLNMTFDATNFWDQPWHFDRWGLTSVTYNVNEQEAKELNMIGYQNGKVYMGVDHTYPYPLMGRPSIQISTEYLFNSGLFILSLDHMPTGPGVWPSWWMTGPEWPNYGEIDIIEGIDNMTYNLNSILAGNDYKGNKNCIEKLNDTNYFNGTWWMTDRQYLDCNHHDKTNATYQTGCSIQSQNGTFNKGFNNAGGGVFALQWDRTESLRIWNFVHPNIPADIANESPNPNPDTWGVPTGYWKLKDNCEPEHFGNHTMMFDIALCGSWVAQYFPGGEAACEQMVHFHPENYTEAYWLINYVKVFCRDGEPCGFLNPQGCTFGC